MNDKPLTRKAWRRIQYEQTKRLYSLIYNNKDNDKDIEAEVLDCIQKGADISRRFKCNYPILLFALVYQQKPGIIKILYDEYPNAINFYSYVWTYKWYDGNIYIKDDIHWAVSLRYGYLFRDDVNEKVSPLEIKETYILFNQYESILGIKFDYGLCDRIGYFIKPKYWDD